MIALWLLLGAGDAPVAPALLNAQLSLSTDHSLGRSDLRVHTFVAEPRPLPSERQGIPLGGCATVVPQSAAADLVMRRAPITASCGGQPVALEEVSPGSYVHNFPAPLPDGTVCVVTLDGVEHTLPPMPPPPRPRFRAGQARWEPSGADELRIVTPRSGGRSTICRYTDGGRGRAPRGAKRTLTFVSRHALGLSEPDAEGARAAYTVTSGVWWTPGESAASFLP